ncbi:9362_t:CDS:1 [Diversispora eburnea]|uniref:9362_t:CDS:1 n=1 Tax=Diversispora eburnea TaxID=1213867 RepID=A0A9N8ZGL5_9GLOM|nr:9362_t:CDS:1 [Diversispora eburnea]
MSTSEDKIVSEITEIHIKNGLKNGNRTMNAFMIYRYCYQKNCSFQDSKPSRNDVSKLASESWKRESDEIKNLYKRIAENVKKRFKKTVNSLCFIHSNLAGKSDNELNFPTSSSTTNCINSPSDQIVPDIIYLNPPIDQNSPDITCPGSPNIDPNIYPSQQTYPQMDQISPDIYYNYPLSSTSYAYSLYTDYLYMGQNVTYSSPLNIEQTTSVAVNTDFRILTMDQPHLLLPNPIDTNYY